jgi:ADP-heptose:LPS heptosyltransferase
LISTSCKDIAQEILEGCLAGAPPRKLPRALVEEPCGIALFSILVEGLADRFEPALCDAYARLFAQAVAYARDDVNPASLVAHYERVRRTRPVRGEPRRVFVLSRVTLGADVAVTSIVLAGAKHRFPDAEIVFVAPAKNYELFAADPQIRHAALAYKRGGLRDRLAVWDQLTELFSAPDSLVLDPDSRLTQLGLLPVCPEDRYHLFESRSCGGDTDKSLSELTAAWVEETLGVTGAKPYVQLPPISGTIATPAPGSYSAVSLGVGENPAKRLPDPFEEELLALLARNQAPLYIDRGAGGEEADRVTRAADRAGVQATFWEGSFAGFASIISGASLYVGYDSAGQHVAAACGVPLISIFAGYPAPRMFHRWRPSGPDCQVVQVDVPNPQDVLRRVAAVLS